MTKKELVKEIDLEIAKAIKKAMSNNTYEVLPLLTNAINYVKANEETLEREKGTVEKSVNQRVKEANERRLKKENNK